MRKSRDRIQNWRGRCEDIHARLRHACKCRECWLLVKPALDRGSPVVCLSDNYRPDGPMEEP